MIGAPTNFQHTGHIGSTDVDMPSSLLHSIQNQMQSKGGYEMAYGVKVYWCTPGETDASDKTKWIMCYDMTKLTVFIICVV